MNDDLHENSRDYLDNFSDNTPKYSSARRNRIQAKINLSAKERDLNGSLSLWVTTGFLSPHLFH